MLKRKLEEKIEVVRKRMEDTAMMMGLGHPVVYQLSLELDQLHNEWQKFCTQRKENVYQMRKNSMHVKENTKIKRYQHVV